MIIRAMSNTTLLPHWGLIRAEGADAAKFLHGQLTHDVLLLGPQEARLAAFCSAQGRMLASFVLFKRTPTELLLACRRDVLPATLKRLQMFVMRAQCQLSDVSDAFDLVGLSGEAATQVAAALPLPDAAWSKKDVAVAEDQLAHVVRLPGAEWPRVLWCAPTGTPLPAGCPVPGADTTEWDWAEVQSGVAMVGQAISGQFVPQMLNFESVGGVNFKKGCYPGQEVVARSQYRGTLKRRATLASCAQPLAAGQELFHSSDAEQPCGTVAMAAAHPLGQGFGAVVSLQISAMAEGTLTLGSATGPVVNLLPLPYPLLQDV